VYPEVVKPNRALHLPAVVSHEQVTLLERAKLGVELEGACLSIPEKHNLEGKPHHTRSGIQSPHDVLEIQGDGPGDPGHGDVVAASPRRVASTGRSVGEDVTVESVAAENKENLAPPSSIGGGGGVEEDVDQVLDVRDPGGLKVEVGDHGVIRATRGSSTRLEQSRRLRLLRGGDALPRTGVEEALRLGDLASKSVSGATLVLPSEGGHTHTLLGGGCRGLEVCQGHNEGVVGGRDGGGTQRQPTEEGGGGEGGSRWRHAVRGTIAEEAREECGTGTAEQQGAARAHCTDTVAQMSSHAQRNPSRDRGSG
jgi:hypothetical protein